MLGVFNMTIDHPIWNDAPKQQVTKHKAIRNVSFFNMKNLK
jgi:hypothetical protein